MVAEGSVAFELRLVEPLVADRLVGEVGAFSGVGQDVGGFAAAKPRLEIEDLAGRTAGLGIPDRADDEDRALPPWWRRIRFAKRLEWRQFDLDAKIDPYLA